MPIYITSRYRDDVVAGVSTTARGTRLAVFPASPGERYGGQTFPFIERVVVEGERWDVIAFQAYGRADLWWLVAMANPEMFDCSGEPTPGAIIRVPDVSNLH